MKHRYRPLPEGDGAGQDAECRGHMDVQELTGCALLHRFRICMCSPRWPDAVDAKPFSVPGPGTDLTCVNYKP